MERLELFDQLADTTDVVSPNDCLYCIQEHPLCLLVIVRGPEVVPNQEILSLPEVCEVGEELFGELVSCLGSQSHLVQFGEVVGSVEILLQGEVVVVSQLVVLVEGEEGDVVVVEHEELLGGEKGGEVLFESEVVEGSERLH